MIKRLLSFLDASPVNFLAVKNIADTLAANGFRRINPALPLGEVKSGDRFFVTKNDSSIYAFRIGNKPIADAGFHMICAHCDSPTFRIKPNAEMLTEGGIVKLNTEVYGGPIMSTWFDRPLTLAGRVIVRGEDVMQPETLLLHIKRPLLQISNLAIHFNRQVNDGVALSKQKDVLPLLGQITSQLETGNLLMNVILEELNSTITALKTFSTSTSTSLTQHRLAHSAYTTSLYRLADSTTSLCAMQVLKHSLLPIQQTQRKCSPSSTTKRLVRRQNRAQAVRSSHTY